MRPKVHYNNTYSRNTNIQRHETRNHGVLQNNNSFHKNATSFKQCGNKITEEVQHQWTSVPLTKENANGKERTKAKERKATKANMATKDTKEKAMNNKEKEKEPSGTHTHRTTVKDTAQDKEKERRHTTTRAKVKDQQVDVTDVANKVTWQRIAK